MNELIIKKLTIYNSDRFPLTDANLIEYTPEQPIQFILGTNGSGKSSIMRMLALTPKDIKNNFFEGGYCVLELTFNGVPYTLKEGVDGPSKYNFIRDGEELNPGKTKTVYVSLIEQHFNLTPLIYKLMFNEITFTRMTANMRKEWFSKMSSISYDYAYSAYNELKTRYRDLKGSMGILKDKIARIEANASNEEMVEKLENDIEYIDMYIAELNRFYFKINDKQKPSHELIQSLTSKLAKYNKQVQQTEVLDLPYLENELKNTEMLVRLKQQEMVDLNERIEKNKAHEKEKIKQLEETLQDIKFPYLEIELDIPAYKTKVDALDIDIRNIISIYNEHVQKEEVVFFDIAKFKELYDEINKTENKLSTIDMHLKHFEDKLKNDDITCPSCKYRFKDGYDEQEHNALKSKREKLHQHYSTLKESYNKLLEIHNMYVEFNDVKQMLLNVFNGLSEPLVTTIQDNTFISQNIVNALLQTETINDIVKIENELKQIQHNNDVTDTTSINDLTHILEKVKEEYHAYRVKVEGLKKKVKEAEEYTMALNSIDNTYETLYGLLKENREYYLNKALENINMLITSDITTMQEHRNFFNALLEKEKQKQYELTIAHRDLDEVIKTMNVIQKAMDALSPKDGLIAESVKSFIGFILDRVTEIVNEIWTYPLEISLPVSDSLDYKFTVKVSPTKKSPDISETSDGMQEVIDLAFKVVTLKMLGFSNYPIFLDEFGRGFDPVHKSNVFKFIEKLSELWFSQVFVVSHFDDAMVTNQANVDVIVTSDMNIPIAKGIKVNKVLKMTTM